jgi:hypothetical protein
LAQPLAERYVWFGQNQIYTAMPKGHNKGHVNEGKDITSGQTGHLKGKAAEKQTAKKGSGRNANEDQSGGTKGSNAI